MKVKPLVSILINNYNYGRFLQEAIDSALNQTYSHIEVVVVDDGSTDNSKEIIASYGNTVISILKENGGQASAFNAGFAVSRGNIICFLDSDDIFRPEKVAEMVNVFGDYQENGWCFHPLKLVNTAIETSSGSTYEGSSHEYDLRTRIKKGKLGNPLPFAVPATSGLCFRRSLLQLILPMPEAEAIALNDSYLKFAALALSKGFALNKELALQRIHGDNAFTLKTDKQQLAKIHILTAYWMRIKFPLLSKFANNLFSTGVGIYWSAGCIETEYQDLVKSYLSSATPLQKLEINSRALYCYLKS